MTTTLAGLGRRAQLPRLSGLVGEARPRRRAHWLLAAGGMIAAGSLLIYGRWVGTAPSSASPAGDAVVVHAPVRGERLHHGLELMEQERARTLVLMLGERSRRARRLCGQTEPFEVICPDPDPVNTVGEARTLAGLVAERGWATVVAVTSDYHLRRAVYLDRRCSGITVLGSAATSRLISADYLSRLGKEMLALPVAALSSC